MKNIVYIQPTQKYMKLEEIKETYGTCWVVAYLCKIKDSTLYGGCVIAVQNQPSADYSELKKFRNKFAKQYPDKNPVYCFRLENLKGSGRLSLIYDNRIEAIRRLPTPKVTKSELEEIIEGIPEKHLALAISTSMKK